MRAINAAVMRQNNRKLILNQIRMRPISRAELAEVTQLTRASITQIVDELLYDGLVMESSAVERSHLGRRSTQLVINPNAAIILGVHLSRIQCDVGAINLRSDVLRHNTVPVAGQSADAVLNNIVQLLQEQRASLEAQGLPVASVGFCAPGPLDPQTGTFLKPPNFPEWHGQNVYYPITEKLGLPVFLENVSNAHALVEKYFGAAAGAENFVLLRVDEGVGAGIFVRGSLYRGAHNFAAEFGHISVDINGPECACGNRGCLEKYVSIPALLEGTPYGSWPQLVDSLGEPAADAVLERLVHYLSAGIVNIINAFDVEKVVLAGDLLYQSDNLLRRLNAAVLPRTIFPMSDVPIVAGSSFTPVLLGSIPAYHSLFSTASRCRL